MFRIWLSQSCADWRLCHIFTSRTWINWFLLTFRTWSRHLVNTIVFVIIWSHVWFILHRGILWLNSWRTCLHIWLPRRYSTMHLLYASTTMSNFLFWWCSLSGCLLIQWRQDVSGSLIHERLTDSNSYLTVHNLWLNRLRGWWLARIEGKEECRLCVLAQSLDLISRLDHARFLPLIHNHFLTSFCFLNYLII